MKPSSGIVPFDLNAFGTIPATICAVSDGVTVYASTGANTLQNVQGSNGLIARRQAYAYDIATGEVTGWDPGGIGGGLTNGATIQALCIGSDGYIYCALNDSNSPYGTATVQGTQFFGICRFHPTTGVVDTGWIFTGRDPATVNTYQNLNWTNAIKADGFGNIVFSPGAQYLNGSGQTNRVYVIAESNAALVRMHTPNAVVIAVAIDVATGDYYLAGSFTVMDGNTRRFMCGFSNAGTLKAFPAPASNPDCLIRALAFMGNLLYFGGHSTGFTSFLRAWDLTTNLLNTTFCPEVYEAGTGLGWGPYDIQLRNINGVDSVIIAGGFQFVGNALRCASASVRASDGALLETPFDGSRISALSGSGIGKYTAYSGAANALYIASFAAPGLRLAIPDSNVVPGSGGIRYSQIGATSSAVKSITIGSTLYLFGNPSNVFEAASIPGNGTAKIAGTHYAYGMVAFDLTTGLITSWAAALAGCGSGSFISGVVLSSDGTKFYVVGNFTTFNGVARKGIASINVVDGTLAAWAPDPSNGSVTPTYISIKRVGTVIMIARLNLETAETTYKWHIYDDAATPTFRVTHTRNTPGTTINLSFMVDGNGKYYLGGDFTQVNGTARVCLARFTALDVLDSFNMAISGSSQHVDAMLLDGNKLYVAGSFTSFGGSTRRALAVWNWSTDALDSFVVQANAGPGHICQMLMHDGLLVLFGSVFTGLDDGAGNFNRSRQGITPVNPTTGYVDPDWFTGTYALMSTNINIEYAAAISAFVYTGQGASLAGGLRHCMCIFLAER